jgi:amidohydrolase
MNSDFDKIKDIIEFRKELHQNPELSGNEKNTAKRIKKFIQQYNPDKIIEHIGGNGLLVVFEGKIPGQTIMFRGDMDALPIQEESTLLHASKCNNISHLCGHDGHTAILANTIKLISLDRPKKGNVVFLFQPAEETGQGALNVLSDNNFIIPDYIFGIHNIPGFPESCILLKSGSIAAASKGMIIKLFGKISHASEPEKGVSPALAMSEIIAFFSDKNSFKAPFNNLILTTVVHAKLGEVAFGTSPGYAEVMVTLRAFSDSDMEWLNRTSIEKIIKVTKENGIEFDAHFVEEFPSTENHSECTEKLISIAKENNFEFQILENPFKWSEDFGHFTKAIPGALIGIGSGIDHPNLHNPNYDFPDRIIPVSTRFLFNIYKSILE